MVAAGGEPLAVGVPEPLLKVSAGEVIIARCGRPTPSRVLTRSWYRHARRPHAGVGRSVPLKNPRSALTWVSLALFP